MFVQTRLEGLRKRLREDKAPAALISLPSNLRYMTAFEDVIDTGISGACVVTETDARFYTDGRYYEAASVAANGGPWEVVLQKENLYMDLCGQLQLEGVNSLLLESGVPYGRFKYVAEQFRGAVKVVDQLVESMRQIKESEEIERIEAAAGIADAGFEHIVEFIKEGMTEREVALELEFHMRKNGSEGIPFDVIVASGPNGARPHAIPGDRRLEAGDLVVIDFGARVGGYCSDMTRTVAIGTASTDQRRLYEAVLEANQAGIVAARAGMPCAEMDGAARDSLHRAGFGDHFTHGLGHGVGLDVHEMPSIGAQSTQSLRRGMVVTVEPGVYLSGVAGVRIEDLVLVEESGCRLLNQATKELIEI